jgi:hypothetical protein
VQPVLRAFKVSKETQEQLVQPALLDLKVLKAFRVLRAIQAQLVLLVHRAQLVLQVLMVQTQV